MVKTLGGRFDLRGLPGIIRSYYSIRSLALGVLCTQLRGIRILGS